MSQEKPTPQNNDDHEQDTIELSNGRSVPKSVVDALRVLDEKWPGATLRMARPAIVAAVMDALHVDGYEITKRADVGITKGLPGFGDELTRTIVDLEGSLMGEALAERIKSGTLDLIAPGATQAAQRGIELANRHIGYVGQDSAAAVAAALDLIGRRTDIVAVQLPEPTHSGNVSTSWGWVTQWHPTHQVRGQTRLITVDDPGRCFTTAEARNLAAALLAAAARVDAAEGEAK